MVTNYLLDIVILLAAAVIAVPLFRAAGLGAVPGFLVAGVLVGPYGLALIDNVTEIGQLAELGVVLLLFVIGIELKPARLWLMRRLVFGLGTLQFVLTGALITAGAYVVFDVPFRTAILIGPALALSSTAFVMQLLAEQKMLHSEYGRASFSVLLLQDLAVVPLLALVPLLAAPTLTIGADIALALAQAIGILLLAIVGGRYLLQPILHRVTGARNREVFTALAVLLVLGSALLTETVGLSMAMGAFIAGLLIADSPFRHGVVAEIQPFRGLLLGLFFMSMGMTLNLGEFFAQPLTVLGMLVALVTLKFVVLWALARSFGLRTKVSAAVAMLLSQSGEFGLILFAYTYQAKLISTDLYVQLLLVIVLSMLVTPPLAYLARQLAAARTDQQKANDEVPTRAPVVLAGFGRVGRHTGQILTSAGEPYVAIDTDPSLVLRERANGYRIFYGDARRPEVLRAVGVKDADLVVVTVDDSKAAGDIVAALHQAYPDVTILARGHDADHCRKLRKLGATIAVSETLGASLELARQVLIRDDRDTAKVEALLRRFHQERGDNPNARSKREVSNRTGA
jgi:monovalent cation:proton antiporter-2 (CPA2) family protein